MQLGEEEPALPRHEVDVGVADEDVVAPGGLDELVLDHVARPGRRCSGAARIRRISQPGAALRSRVVPVDVVRPGSAPVLSFRGPGRKLCWRPLGTYKHKKVIKVGDIRYYIFVLCLPVRTIV